ncbi:hypothetical protein LAUMK191_00164 [Mycobacterium attenuatum]|uniref:DUF1275 family protein n=1 Tax=Mycobacterium attenuatum TaxID=2341086 RepID=A0A498PMP9_9MYCO|nr:hypothetical protein LAUMK136_00180 [Mycobacterium attenuatum]VBA44915.1 hypothetical protein LAUMK191_00164 [Mycobacterium attenuatum]
MAADSVAVDHSNDRLNRAFPGCAVRLCELARPRPNSADPGGLWKHARVQKELYDSEAKLSWVLAGLAGVLGATAFTHSAGYFVTFMTGNAQRAVLGVFRDDVWLSITASLLIVCFVGGVVIASICRRHLWVAHPHGPTVLTTFSLVAATSLDILLGGWEQTLLDFVPILFIVFGIGALNTSFVKDGEVSVPLSYVTGTLVKMGQGIERHLAGGKAADWLGYFLLYASFTLGAAAGGVISLVVSGSQMLAAATIVCAITTGYTYFHSDRRALLKGS